MQVNPLPSPAQFSISGVKVYITLVKVQNAPPGLRPGMAAQSEIIVSELDNVLSVPIEAVLRYGGKDHVAVKKPDGGFDWRSVFLGVTNDKSVQVTYGLKSGEVVAPDPSVLMSDEERRQKSVTHPRPDPNTGYLK